MIEIFTWAPESYLIRFKLGYFDVARKLKARDEEAAEFLSIVVLTFTILILVYYHGQINL